MANVGPLRAEPNAPTNLFLYLLIILSDLFLCNDIKLLKFFNFLKLVSPLSFFGFSILQRRTQRKTNGMLMEWVQNVTVRGSGNGAAAEDHTPTGLGWEAKGA